MGHLKGTRLGKKKEKLLCLCLIPGCCNVLNRYRKESSHQKLYEESRFCTLKACRSQKKMTQILDVSQNDIQPLFTIYNQLSLFL